MKNFLLVIMIVAAASAMVMAQKSGAAATSGKEILATAKWNTTALQKWGVASIELPDNLLAKDDEVSAQKNDDVTWTDSSALWSPIGKKSGPKIFEMSVDVTTWDVPFAKIAPDLNPNLATPENFLKVDVDADIRNKQERKDSIVLEAGYYKIGGVNGGLTIIRDPGDKTRTVFIWQTFRFYKTKPQRVKIQITAARTERAAAIRIIDSLRLEQPGI